MTARTRLDILLVSCVLAAGGPCTARADELQGHQVFLQDVSWSPDGRHIAFSRYEGTGKYDPDNWAVWIADRDGAHPHVVLRGGLWTSFSPDGQRLVAQKRIEGDWEIVTLASDGGDLRRLTTRPGDDDVPSWSPDGKTIVFTSEVAGNRDVWQLPVGGGSPRRLTTDAAADYNPVYSPDGEKVVFYREKGDEHDQVWVVDLRSGAESRLTDGSGHNFFPTFLPDGRIAWSGAKDAGERRLLVQGPNGAPVPLGPAGINFARWSPDGAQVLFTGGFPDSQVMRMAADGSAVTPLLDVAKLEAPAVYSGYPSVSPDGRRIAFLSNRDGADDLYVMDADGSHQARLTSSAEDEGGTPRWSPDSKEVWFAVSSHDRSRLYAVSAVGGTARTIGEVPGRSVDLTADGKRVLYSRGSWTSVTLLSGAPDGGGERVLAKDAAVLWNARWSPDGRRIAYTGDDPDPKVDDLHVYVMNADGSGIRQVTHLPLAEGRAQVPEWSPDGHRLALQASFVGGDRHRAELWVVDAASGQGRKVGAHDAPYIDECPAWFPDGRRLAFQSDRSGRMEVWTVGVDGSTPEQLTGVR